MKKKKTKPKVGEIESQTGDNSLICTCGTGEVIPIKELPCKDCGEELKRCAKPKYHCSKCSITIGQIFYYKCSGCGNDFHCKDVWNCNESCSAEFKCTGCGATSKEQVKIKINEDEWK